MLSYVFFVFERTYDRARQPRAPPAGMPCELVQHFSPASPLLVGGVLPAEEGTGHMQLRLKRHRWFPRVLKTRDPLVFSIGACRRR